MPTINKQNPAPRANGRSPAKPGSILSRAIPVADIEDDWIKMVLYGRNRIGKTTLACLFPKPLLLVAMEPAKTGGAKSVKKTPGVTYLRLDNSEDIIKLATDELRGACPFKTVVVDSATSLQDMILKELVGSNEVPVMLRFGMVSEDQYRERSEKLREALRPFLQLEAHVVVTANEKDHNPPESRKSKLVRGAQLESFFAADLGGGTVKWLHDTCDYICQMYMEKEVKIVKALNPIDHKEYETEHETGRLVRRLRTMYHTNFAAGIRSPTPERVPEFIDEPTFDKIHQIAKGEWPVQPKN